MNSNIEDEILECLTCAEKGDPYAQNQMGVEFATGKSLEKNDFGAAYWYAKAACLGFVESKWNLATMFWGKDALAQNWDVSYLLIENLVKDGYPDARRFMYETYFYGNEVREQDLKKAEELKIAIEKDPYPDYPDCTNPINIFDMIKENLDKPEIKFKD